MQWSRRTVLSGLALSSLFPARALAVAPLAIPTGTMRLSRRMTRGLHDGKSIVVERFWAVNFARQGRGVAISGEQIAVDVIAPKKLDPFVDIERARSTEDMWPILLTDSGSIMATGEYTRHGDVAAAIDKAEEILANQAQDEGSIERQSQHLKQIRTAGTYLIDQIPSDLFYPAKRHETLSRAMDLPDGAAGSFELIYTNALADDGPWMAQSVREITTRIGDEEIHSKDLWRMDHL